MGWDSADDLDDDIPVPGSKPRRQVNAEAVKEVADNLWDALPRTYRVNGQNTELFAVGAIAKALQREVVTIRSWERRGWLPKPALRAPGAHQHRLYSRRFIEGAIAIAQEEGLFKPGALVGSTEFPKRVFALFQEVGG